MPFGYGKANGIMSGLNEGITNFVNAVNDNKKLADEKAFREAILRKEGLIRNPDTGAYDVDPEVKARQAAEEKDKKLRIFGELLGKAGELETKGVRSKALNSLIQGYGTESGLLGSGLSGGIAPASNRSNFGNAGNRQPQGFIGDEPDRTPSSSYGDTGGLFEKIPGFMSQDDKKLAAERRKQEYESSPKGRFEKGGAELKQKLGFIANGLESLTDYENAFRSGGRQGYLTPDTPIIGRFKDSTPIDEARSKMEDAIGRLESGGAIAGPEIEMYRKWIPTAADGPESAARKLQNFRKGLETKLKFYGFPVDSLKDLDLGIDPKTLGYGTEEAGLENRGLLKPARDPNGPPSGDGGMKNMKDVNWINAIRDELTSPWTGDKGNGQKVPESAQSATNSMEAIMALGGPEELVAAAKAAGPEAYAKAIELLKSAYKNPILRKGAGLLGVGAIAKGLMK